MKVENFLKDGFHGLCMACADSVPGVSGGTVAFLMGFYERFVGAIDSLVFGTRQEKLPALLYLLRLGVVWAIGFGVCAVLISKMFSENIYIMSSLFLGFTVAAIPVVAAEELPCVKKFRAAPFFVPGLLLVVLASRFNSVAAFSSLNLAVPSISTWLILFAAGFIAISAMILPGISGSTLLLIMGLYLPIINAVKELIHLHFSFLPAVAFFGLGVLTGLAGTARLLKNLLENHRAPIIYLVLGLMTGSLYAIYKDPATLSETQPPLSLDTFSMLAFVIGIAVIVVMYLAKRNAEEKDDCSAVKK
mgnify:CR=1 FL=1